MGGKVHGNLGFSGFRTGTLPSQSGVAAVTGRIESCLWAWFGYFPLYMSGQAAFHRGVSPLLQLLLPGKEEAVLAAQSDQPLRERIEELAAKSTEDALTPEERDEYAGYVRANKFVAVLRREAKKFKAGSAA